MRKRLKEIFCVSSGSYSDYRVLAVFESRDDAEKWASFISRGEGVDYNFNSDAHVESMPFVPAGLGPYTESSWSHSVTFWDDGTIQQGAPVESVDTPITAFHGPAPTRPHLRFVRAPSHQDKGGRLDIRAATKAQCLKVASERIAAWKAGSWITKDLHEWTNDAR